MGICIDFILSCKGVIGLVRNWFLERMGFVLDSERVWIIFFMDIEEKGKFREFGVRNRELLSL